MFPGGETHFTAFLPCDILSRGRERDNRMTSIITARRLLRGNEFIEYPRITIDDGHITSILSRRESAVADAYPDATLIQAYLTIHAHGPAGPDVLERPPNR